MRILQKSSKTFFFPNALIGSTGMRVVEEVLVCATNDRNLNIVKNIALIYIFVRFQAKTIPLKSKCYENMELYRIVCVVNAFFELLCVDVDYLSAIRKHHKLAPTFKSLVENGLGRI